jgi:hypothetical protein
MGETLHWIGLAVGVASFFGFGWLERLSRARANRMRDERNAALAAMRSMRADYRRLCADLGIKEDPDAV